MRTAQFTRFRVPAEAVPSMLEARRAWASEGHTRERLHGGLLVALEDGEWLDVSIWDRLSPGGQDHKGAHRLAEFVDRIDRHHVEFLGQESGIVTWLEADRSDGRAGGEAA